MRFRIAIASLLILVIVSCTNNNQHQAISPRVNHVMLYVSDLEKSIQFYTQAFDFEITNRLDTLIATQPDGTELVRPVKMAFLKFPNQDFVFELSEQVADTTNRPVAFLFQHVGIDVQDIDASFSRAMGAGAEALLPVRVVKAKGVEAKQAFVGGPDGERVELMQIMAGEF
jgi:catechol 2,3-dioxygenase-like lactoylglutathione lyase family enzyme